MQPQSQAVLASKHFIRFSDCDPMGHLFNVKYLDYFLNAREDQVRDSHQLNMAILSKKYNWALLVGKHQIAYLNSALMNEQVIISSVIIDQSPKWIVVEYLMTGKNNEVKSFMWSHFVSFNSTKKTTAHVPEDIRSIIVENTIEKPAPDFDSRFMQLREGGIGYSIPGDV
ncbi:MAG: acyl-CoA thioesterase [Saprospirales bacterium]|nr:MAG: acyl-CoA thioesterase [Saprospirales bacterium]